MRITNLRLAWYTVHTNNLSLQVLWPQLLTVAILVGSMVLTQMSDISGNVFMAIILTFQFVIGLTNATITGGIYNMAGWLPSNYIQASLLTQIFLEPKTGPFLEEKELELRLQTLFPIADNHIERMHPTPLYLNQSSQAYSRPWSHEHQHELCLRGVQSKQVSLPLASPYSCAQLYSFRLCSVIQEADKPFPLCEMARH